MLFVCLCGMSESKAAYILEFVPHFETFFRAFMLSSLHSRVCAHFETFFRAIAKLMICDLLVGFLIRQFVSLFWSGCL
jgi:hypothetical protein